MDERPFPCATPGCEGERLYHQGSEKYPHGPAPYDTNPLCPFCRAHGPLFGPDVAAEAQRLAERLVRAKEVYP